MTILFLFTIQWILYIFLEGLDYIFFLFNVKFILKKFCDMQTMGIEKKVEFRLFSLKKVYIFICRLVY